MKKKEKPSLFDIDICVKLENSERCQGCCFWENIKKISLITGQRFKDEYRVEVKDEDLDEFFEDRMAGCAVLTEICPNCIVNLSEFKEHKLGLVCCNEQHESQERIICEPAFLCPRGKLGNQTFYCPICKKEYKHSEVKHLIHSVRITKKEYPNLMKLKGNEKIKIWQCGYCKKEYNSKKEADECSDCHKDDKKTKKEIKKLNKQ